MDDFIPTRASLLNRLKDPEDQRSWQDFYNIYSRVILDLSLKAGLNRTEAQDVLQETMMSVCRHMPTFKYDPSLGSFKNWLFTMTRWRIADQIRNRGAVCREGNETATGTGLLERIPDPMAEGLDRIWEAEWEKGLLAAALQNVRQRLDPERYQIFDLYVNKGWAPEKVAMTFGIPVSQVYLAKHRITEMIRDEVVRLNKEIT
jgi:RNA polymerase sigma factor (sigma-70 family)